MSYQQCYGPRLYFLIEFEFGLPHTDATNAAGLQSETEMLKLLKRDDSVVSLISSSFIMGGRRL